MKIQLTINALCTSLLFGMWNNSIEADGFIFLLLGFVLSTVDYCFTRKNSG